MMKMEKFLPKLKFNKFELIFILERKRQTKEEITVQVENEINKEMFVLDNKEIMVKLKLLNSKEKFMIKIISSKTKQPIDAIFLDLEEKFGSDEINFDKKYSEYSFSVSLSISDKKQQDELADVFSGATRTG